VGMALLDWNQCPTVERVPGKVSGVWLCRRTRVPVKALFENLEDGASVDDFLLWFPGAKREQVLAVLAIQAFEDRKLLCLRVGGVPKIAAS
jgi:uncharacterized protein (DUF433 family)